MKKKIIYLLFPLLFAACNSSVLNPKVESQSFSYKFSVNGCTTDEKIFGSNEAMCEGLRNDSLNNFCAQDLRYQKFQSDCPGRAW